MSESTQPAGPSKTFIGELTFNEVEKIRQRLNQSGLPENVVIVAGHEVIKNIGLKTTYTIKMRDGLSISISV